MRASICFAILLAMPMQAAAHTATPTAAMPLGWAYPPECCQNIDCSVIDAKYVKEGPDGFEINLPVGAHPMLKTKGYVGIVPYSAARSAPDGEYHICLGTDGYTRFCFFAGSRGS